MKHSILVSFFSEKNSSEEGSSNGCIGFFLLKRTANGRFRRNRSELRDLRREEDDEERRNRVFFAFSVLRGARFANALAERAFLGFL